MVYCKGCKETLKLNYQDEIFFSLNLKAKQDENFFVLTLYIGNIS